MTRRNLVRWGLLAVPLLALPVAAFSDPLNVKPGLWEVVTTTHSSGLPAMDLSKLPAEQRAKIEAMMKEEMAKQAAPKTTRECMTKEKIEKELFKDKDMDPSCRRTSVVATGAVQEFKIECGKNQQKMTGTMRFEAVTPENVKGAVKVVTEGGTSFTATSTFVAKWLGADCGDVK
jgi:Protein of unknown function (DUF3617)